MNIADFLVGDEDDGVVEFRRHLVGVGDKIRRNVTSVELHTFHHVELGCHSLALFDGDYAVLADFLHSVGNELTDFLVACGDRRNLSDSGLVLNFLAYLFKLFDCNLGCLHDTAFKHHGVCAGSNVFQAFFDDCLRQNGCGCSTVARNVVGLCGNFSYDLRAHILKRVGKHDVFCDSHAVVGDERRTVRTVEHNVSTLWAESDFNSICQCVDACFQSLSCVVAVFKLFCHKT